MSYTTNFKPADFLFFNDLSIFKKKTNNKIISRNFFLFLILLKYTKLNEIFKLDISVFVKPNYKKVLTILRAPYRYKLARHQFMLSRYYLLLSIKMDFVDLFFDKNNELIFFVKLIKNFYF